MKTLHNHEQFYNYAKNKYVTVRLNPCPVCHNEAVLISEYEEPDGEISVGHGYAACSNNQCSCRTRDYYTDTNHYADLGIEQAQKEWNSSELDYLQ